MVQKKNRDDNKKLKMTKETHAKKLISLGEVITGNVAGTVVGFLIGGPPGALIGATVGPIATTMLKAGNEFMLRAVSPGEIVKIGAGYTYALDAIKKHIENGKSPRTDGFSDARSSGTSSAYEILEGALIKCKNEHEEKKMKFIGNIFANAAFTNVSADMINRVLKIAERMTYRQICLLSLVGQQYKLDFDTSTFSLRNSKSGEAILVFCEVQDSDDVIIGEGAIRKGLSPVGQMCFELMGLQDVPKEDLDELMSTMKGNPLFPS